MFIRRSYNHRCRLMRHHLALHHCCWSLHLHEYRCHWRRRHYCLQARCRPLCHWRCNTSCMQHFLNDFTTIRTEISIQDSMTQVHTCDINGFFRLPPLVKVCASSSMSRCVQFLFSYGSWMACWGSRLTTSWEVRPPGMTHRSVFMSLVLLFTLLLFTPSTKCARNASNTSRLFFRSMPPGLTPHTFRSQTYMPSSSIQLLRWTCTTRSGGTRSLGIVMRLKMTMGFSLVPSATRARTTMKWSFSCPDVLIT